jgi:CRISPR-associated protein (TIGR03986 family)
VEGQKPPRFDRYDPDGFTGSLDIELTTLTPVFVRGAVDPQQQERQDLANGQPVDFFHRGDSEMTPVIPGSTLRGMVRGVFEILTWSRLEFISPRRLFYRSFADPVETGLRELYQRNFDPDRVVAGVLSPVVGGLTLRVSAQTPTGFVVVPANDPTLRSSINTSRRNIAVRVHAAVEDRSADLRRGALGRVAARLIPTSRTTRANGWLIVPGRDVNRRSWYQVIIDPDAEDATGSIALEYDVPYDAMSDYEAWGALAHGARFGTDRAPRRLKEGEPAFGMLDESDNVVVLGANMMMPLRYKHSLAEIAARQQDAGGVATQDMTRAVFGFVPASAQHDPPPAVKSRVSFEDAVCAAPDPHYSDHGVFPDILASPKPTSFQMYARASADGRPVHWDNDPGAAIRGFKRYWHQPDATPHPTLHEIRPVGINDPMSTHIRPVRTGVRFIGRVHFENLTAEEFGALVASIHLPDGLAHKVGMAKSLGLGSVDVRIAKLCLVDAAARYASLAPRAGVREFADFRQSEQLREAYAAFVRYVLPGSRSGSLWDPKRMRALALTLSVDPVPGSDEIRQVGLNDGRQWTARYVLPEPAEVLEREQGAIRDIIPVAALQGAAGRPSLDAAARTPRDLARLAAPTAPNRPPTAAPPTERRRYADGERIYVTVITLTGNFRGTVRLEDGSEYTGASVGVCSEGEKIKMKVKADSAGKIKELTRA